MPIFWLDNDTGEEPVKDESSTLAFVVFCIACGLCIAVIVAGLFS